jgi:thiosulfate dehydrogenase (quinone)
MSTLTLDGTAAASSPAAQRSKADALRVAALSLLSIRFIQGFVYWGGGSRRFIYAPAKLDPNAASWMANKFQSAMPGACSEPTISSPFCCTISIFSMSR